MAASNPYVSGSETLLREDLSDLISNLHPAEAPLHTALEHIPITQRRPEYGWDKFKLNRTIAATSSQARAEAATVVVNTPVYPEGLRLSLRSTTPGIEVSETDRASLIAGIPDPFEYRAYLALVEVVNDQEMAMMWGAGSLATAATRLSQGMVKWIAYSGLERQHGTATGVTDVHGVQITSDFFANFYNANGSNLDRSILNNKILGDAWTNGFQVDNCIGFCGQRLKNLVAEFAQSANGTLNERVVPAYDKMFVDTLDAIQTPMGVIWINLNRYLEISGETLTVNKHRDWRDSVPRDAERVGAV